MNNDTIMTLVGNLVDDPTLRHTRGGHAVTNFRVASTPSRYDGEQNKWIDGKTLFVTVTAWRALATHIVDSLHKGDPVVVKGRYFQREYELNEQLRTTYELEALAVGHDLTRGTSRFTRVARQMRAPAVELDPDGVPADLTDRYLDYADEVDRDTGEVREPALAG